MCLNLTPDSGASFRNTKAVKNWVNDVRNRASARKTGNLASKLWCRFLEPVSGACVRDLKYFFRLACPLLVRSSSVSECPHWLTSQQAVTITDQWPSCLSVRQPTTLTSPSSLWRFCCLLWTFTRSYTIDLCDFVVFQLKCRLIDYIIYRLF